VVGSVYASSPTPWLCVLAGIVSLKVRAILRGDR